VYRRTVFATALVVLVIDQVTKALAVAHLEHRAARQILGTFLQFSFARNPGAAFSVGTGSTWIFTALATVVSIVIVRTASKLTHPVWAMALGGLLGGAIGNLTDRLVRWPGHFQGHVVDFIALPHYPVFNVADCGIVCAAVAMVVMSLRGIEMT
jgi:signal peptidase II